MERKYINNFKLTAATVGALLALISAGCAEKNENKEKNIKETTTRVTTTLETTGTTQTTYTQTLKTTGVKVTTLPTTTTKTVTTAVKPNYNQEVKATKETYATVASVQTTESQTETSVETQQTEVTTMPQATESITTTEAPVVVRDLTFDEIKNAIDILYNTDVKSYVRLTDVQEAYIIFQVLEKGDNLTKQIEENFGVKLSDKEKERYDTLFEKTGKKYKECLFLYETLETEKANKLFEELITNKEYVNIDDIIQMYIYAANGYMDNQQPLEMTSYKIKDNSIVFANGFEIKNALPESKETNIYNPFTIINHFSDEYIDTKDDEETIKTYGICTLLPNLIKNLRIGIDKNTTEFYTFTPQAINQAYSKAATGLYDKYEITFWKEGYILDQQGEKKHAYLLASEKGDKLYCDEESEIYNEIVNCDMLNSVMNKEHDYRNFDYDYVKLSDALSKQYEEQSKQYTK